jgi:hypothetical protein
MTGSYAHSRVEKWLKTNRPKLLAIKIIETLAGL